MTKAAKVIGLVMAVVLSGCTLRSNDEVARHGGEGVRGTVASLRAFDACDPLLDELQELGEGEVNETTGGAGTDMLAPNERGLRASGPVTSLATEDAAASAATADTPAWGGTNVQEAGVDEPDVVKTDGSTVLAVAGDRLHIVDLVGGVPQEVGAVPVPYGSQLLVDGTTALVLSASEDGAGTDLTAVDLTTASEPTVRERIRLDGYLTNARMVDGMVRVVTTTGGPRIAFDVPTATRAAETARRNNLDALRSTQIDDWLPAFRTVGDDGAVLDEEPAVTCENVFVPETPTGTNMVNVVSVDLRADDLEPAGGASVVGVGETVYASPERLYVTSTGWDPSTTSGSTTDVHQFSITGREPASYLASGRVSGWLLNQFSMSEHGGDLRVAVTDTDLSSTHSSVVVLRASGDELVEVGRVDGLGRGEQIRSVRFLGDVGYVVTFRQTDPLYTIDLSDPTAPRAVGELKIPGYSSYLHPAGDGRLIGIGQDATAQGQVTGLQIALFDVSDPAAPEQLQKLVLPGASSTAESDHHAFLWWAERGLAVVPVVEWSGTPGFQGAVAFSVAPDGIGERGRLGHGGAVPIDRVVVVGDALVSISASGLAVTDPASLAEEAFLPFA